MAAKDLGDGGLLIGGAGDARGGDCDCGTRCGSHAGIVPAIWEERTFSVCSLVSTMQA